MPFGEEGVVGNRWRERVAPGSLTWPPDIPVVTGHENSAPLGRGRLREVPGGVEIEAAIVDSHPMAPMIREEGAAHWAWSIAVHPEGMERSRPQLVAGVSRTAITKGRILYVGLLPRGAQVYEGAIVERIE